MKTRPDESCLLDDVLAESMPAPDSLEPLLRAVRVRRRRAKVAPVAAAVAVLLLSVFGPGLLNPRNPAGSSTPPLAHVGPVPSRHAPIVERIQSHPLARSEWVTTAGNTIAVERIASRPERSLRATDGELLALAGGRGVGLFRFSDGTAVLLTAGN
ncbi:MAG: hypothetical protein JNL10_22285 [Verrucomicrobiales bacterium]|nr:hypothetical protein [Verrucomicrobiales bacterium]